MKEGSSPYQYRILVVDDEPDILLTLKIVLEENGFKTEHVMKVHGMQSEDIYFDRIPANFLCQTISKLEDK
jgi:DNA-binding response OmpR family regulator